MTSTTSAKPAEALSNGKEHLAALVDAWLINLRRAAFQAARLLITLLGALSFLQDPGDRVDLWLGLGDLAIAGWSLAMLMLIWRAQTPRTRRFTAACISTLVALLLLSMALLVLVCAVLGGGS